MKIGIVSLVLGALLVSGCSSSGASADASTDTETAASSLSPAQLFQRRCASCHGAGGRGDGQLSSAYPMVADLTSHGVQDRLSDEDIAGVIRDGVRRMPPVRGISDEEIQAIISHVRTLVQ